jgi:hypothetical protein
MTTGTKTIIGTKMTTGTKTVGENSAVWNVTTAD